ncbi:LCP family protein [Ihubacter sp. mB4P-1]|uniref:LCP family protein n=1 Tax=Ihubacter sp. mB4P-1 TaxID=3242370 RepID=UPI00137B91BE
MRSDKHKNIENKQKGGLYTFTRFWAVLYILASAAFFGVVIYMDLLPAKYIYISAGIVAVLILLLFPALYFRRFKKSRRIISLVLSMAVMAVYGVGIVYMAGTMDFLNKITTRPAVQTVSFDVIVRSDSAYENADNIKGLKVQTYLDNDRLYSEAKNRLQQEQGVEYEMQESLTALSDGLLDQTYEVLFISEASYSTLCSERQNFETDTKVIYQVKIEKETQEIAKKVDVTSEPFNFYVSGLDIEGAIDTVSRSDVNMIVTVNPKTHRVLLTSLPRDAYIDLKSVEAKDKLTHTGLMGIEETVGVAENLLGIDINYYGKVNYTTVTRLVDAIGGIDVESDYTFTTHGMGVYYQFYEGPNHLDGSMALAFARERKSFPDGDLQRNRNQQIVLEGILKKALSSSTILTKYTSILNAVEDNVDLNLSQEDIQKLVKMQLDGMPSWKIERQSIIGQSGMEPCYSTGDFAQASVVYLDQESIIKALDKIVAVMEEE